MSAAENAAIVAANFKGFNARDRQATQIVAPGAESIDVPSGRKTIGPDGQWEFWSFWTTAFPDANVEVQTNVGAGDGTVVTEFRGRGTHNGPLMMPDGQAVPPTGRKVDIPFCQVAVVENGKIAGSTLYYDVMTMLRQLGLIPETAQAR